MRQNTQLIQGDCLEVLKDIQIDAKRAVIVTDPPFNIGYKYDQYKDRMKEETYFSFLREVFKAIDCSFVVVHYPEEICKLSIVMKEAPKRVISWVYNSNTAKQHRDIAFFKIKPNMNQVKQPYKNPNDKRIKERIAKGIGGGRLYDWWNINQVKNVQKKEIDHPCVMPLEVMKRVIGVLPKDSVIIDPFMGSGTTGLACIELSYDFIGIELSQKYFEIAKKRIGEKETCLKTK